MLPVRSTGKKEGPFWILVGSERFSAPIRIGHRTFQEGLQRSIRNLPNRSAKDASPPVCCR